MATYKDVIVRGVATYSVKVEKVASFSIRVKKVAYKFTLKRVAT